MLHVDIKKNFQANGRVSFSLDVTFTVERGITVLFGPSGSGKTSVLRAIAGILSPDAGKITLGDNTYFDSKAGLNLSIQQRSVGFVFQDYLLFPHLTAVENAAYGVKAGNKTARRLRAYQLLEVFGVHHVAHRYPHQLSGGEQQRVALARAMGSDPSVLLLDEPLSAVDASARSRLLGEIVEIERRSAIPLVYVTHSPADAVRAGHAVLVINAGRIVQEGNPAEVFNAPRSVEGSRAVGPENILLGRVLDHDPGQGTTMVDVGGRLLVVPYNALPKASRVIIGIRAEDIIVSREPITHTSARNLLNGTIQNIIRDNEKIELVVSCGVDVKVSVTPQAIEALDLRAGLSVFLLIKASACRVLS